ncbi:hypothetical protein NEOLI_001811 [Neolecta irregularis DAH-3]|uniref:Uncharacterized protein n=1 Tax=Neolecta irregularis (strain DAH-3) TaxID=1198029 RepID=A0A1U7LPJ5_NEOID|nr:hypothetical protein NEOLI_001811 [Neolecta irregularis DAH-3]|eukprot:OLL24548.1 hypothetical protein NEOLI_001811 [Neolecta irregularis DAH-3]
MIIENGKQFDRSIIRRLLEPKKHPQTDLAWKFLVSGTLKSQTLILRLLYQTEKKRGVSSLQFCSAVNVVISHLIQLDEIDKALVVLSKCVPKATLTTLRHCLMAADSEQTLETFWSLTKISGQAKAYKLEEVYVAALTKFNYQKAKSILLESPEAMGREAWRALLEKAGDLKNFNDLYNLFQFSRQHNITRKIETVFFQSLAKIFPEEVYAKFKKQAAYGSNFKETKLLALLHPRLLSRIQLNLSRDRSIWSIPLLGFLANSNLARARDVLRYAERVEGKPNRQMYLSCLKYSRRQKSPEDVREFSRLHKECEKATSIEIAQRLSASKK